MNAPDVGDEVEYVVRVSIDDAQVQVPTDHDLSLLVFGNVLWQGRLGAKLEDCVELKLSQLIDVDQIVLQVDLSRGNFIFVQSAHLLGYWQPEDSTLSDD